MQELSVTSDELLRLLASTLVGKRKMLLAAEKAWSQAAAC